MCCVVFLSSLVLSCVVLYILVLCSLALTFLVLHVLRCVVLSRLSLCFLVFVRAFSWVILSSFFLFYCSAWNFSVPIVNCLVLIHRLVLFEVESPNNESTWWTGSLCLILSCVVVRCIVSYYLVLSCLVLTKLILSRPSHVMSLSCHVFSLSCLTSSGSNVGVSFLASSLPRVSVFFLSCLFLVLSCPALSCLQFPCALALSCLALS